MLLLIGLVLLIISCGLFFLMPTKEQRANAPSHASVWYKIPRQVMLVTAIVGALMACGQWLVFYAQPGYQYMLVHLNGSKQAVFDEGPHLRWAAKIVPWQKFIDVKVVPEGKSTKDIEGVMDPIGIRFIDQVEADVILSNRFQLPSTEADFIKFAIEFRTLDNFVNNTLIPTVNEVVSNTGYMFAAQDYISGSASDFRSAIEDQLKFGSFSIEKTAHYDTLYADVQVKGKREIREIKTRYEVKKRLDPDGLPILMQHDIAKNNVIVSQVIVDDVELEGDFRQRLKAQRDESAKRQLEQQKVKTAVDAQARILAEGERDKASERVTQEKEQVKALIAIETKLKTEETNRQLAKIQLETKKLDAAAIKVGADAKAYKNAKLVKAGLTPQERALIDKDTAIGVAAEIAKMRWPQTMIVGGDGADGGGMPLESLIGAAMSKQLLEPVK
jgi:hypothetical protein